MGLLDNVLSTIDAKKRTLKRGLMDMIDNPSQWAGMQADRIQEDRYGGAENAQAMKQYLSKQPYDAKALTAANDALRNAAINESLGAVTVWHGSPHKFEKFDMSKIGTGEGAQAYGHGLYVAEHPDTAKMYADKVKDMGAVADINAELSRLSKIMSADEIPGSYRKYRSDSGKNAAQRYDELLSKRNSVRTAPGNTYKVDIPDEAISRMLDWDKPLSEQAPEVRQALERAEISVDRNALGAFDDALLAALEGTGSTTLPKQPLNPAGEDVYRKLGGPSVAAEKLRVFGIPGIRYLDGGSRGAGAGTSNYVLFDDKLPRILETNGKPTGLQPWAKGEWKGLLDDAPQRPLTEFEQRHLTAQRNAALPVEQGGLGLPPNNTAMDRAKAMGYTTPAYHGTGDDRVARSRQFKDSMLGKNTRVDDAKKGHFTASTGEAASEYTWNNGDMTGNVLPLLLRGERDTKRIPGEWMPGSYDSFIDSAKQSGKDGVTITGATTLGNRSDVHVTFNPANIRSRFAAFDPMRRHEADILGHADPRLLGAMAGGGLLGLGGYSLMGDQ